MILMLPVLMFINCGWGVGFFPFFFFVFLFYAEQDGKVLN